MLAMTGDIGAANKGKKLELDLASLESMPRVRPKAAEPFLCGFYLPVAQPAGLLFEVG